MRALGFACLLATMLVYSAAAMPFQRFATLPDLVEVFGTELEVAAAAGLLAAVLAALPRTRGLLRRRAVMVVGGVAFLAGNAAFCALVLGAAGPVGTELPAGVLNAVGVAVGVGCVAQCLAWGRALAVYDLRRATAVVAAAAVVAALIGWAQLMLPEVGAVVLFMACSLACVALPFGLGRERGDAWAAGVAGARANGDARAAGIAGAGAPAGAASEPGVPDASAGEATPTRTPLVVRARAFLDVALVPAIGLVLFAMMMGVRGELFFEDYPHYVAIQVMVAALLFVCVLLPIRRPMVQAIYRGLIPTLAAVVLAVNYLSEALLGGSRLEISLVILLYSAAALLTLSTLVGMAHAGEFPADLISALTVGIFALVTVATQRAFPMLGLGSEGDVRAFVVLSSGVYAAGMIVHAIWRGLRSGDAMPGETDGAALWDAGAVRGVGAAGSARASQAGVGAGVAGAARAAGARDAALEALGPTLEERCDALAASYALTGREREILGYLARGHSGVYIGDELLISPNTVRTHIHNIYRKLGVSSREDVILLVRDAR